MLPTIPSRHFGVRSFGTFTARHIASSLSGVVAHQRVASHTRTSCRLLVQQRGACRGRCVSSSSPLSSSSLADGSSSTDVPTTSSGGSMAESTPVEGEVPAGARDPTPSREHDEANSSRPRASNPPFRFPRQPSARGTSHPSHFASREVPAAPRRREQRTKGPFARRPLRPKTDAIRTVADWLASHGRRPVAAEGATTGWVRIDNVSPTSSLEGAIVGMQEALDRHGILDVDAPWDPSWDALVVRAGHGTTTTSSSESATGLPAPSLPVLSLREDFPNDSWIVQARVVLSPFARPTGWYVQLANRSLVHALLSAVEEVPLTCASRIVAVRAAPPAEIRREIPGLAEPLGAATTKGGAGNNAGDMTHNHPVHRQLLQVSDATLRIENCSEKTSVLKLLNLFSRYDLRQVPVSETNSFKDLGTQSSSPATPFDWESTSIVPWTGRTSDGKAPPTTWLVHFRNASWARAALRELQGTNVDGRPLLLAQYPQQITINGSDNAAPEIRHG